MMLVICCICGKQTGEKEGEGISHTYCIECAKKEMEKLEGGYANVQEDQKSVVQGVSL